MDSLVSPPPNQRGARSRTLTSPRELGLSAGKSAITNPRRCFDQRTSRWSRLSSSTLTWVARVRVDVVQSLLRDTIQVGRDIGREPDTLGIDAVVVGVHIEAAGGVRTRRRQRVRTSMRASRSYGGSAFPDPTPLCAGPICELGPGNPIVHVRVLVREVQALALGVLARMLNLAGDRLLLVGHGFFGALACVDCRAIIVPYSPSMNVSISASVAEYSCGTARAQRRSAMPRSACNLRSRSLEDPDVVTLEDDSLAWRRYGAVCFPTLHLLFLWH
jgi:hypothetical protein